MKITEEMYIALQEIRKACDNRVNCRNCVFSFMKENIHPDYCALQKPYRWLLFGEEKEGDL